MHGIPQCLASIVGRPDRGVSSCGVVPGITGLAETLLGYMIPAMLTRFLADMLAEEIVFIYRG